MVDDKRGEGATFAVMQLSNRSSLRLAGVFALAGGLGAQEALNEIVVKTEPCELIRPVESLFVRSSKTLVLRGTATVGDESFDIYLPRKRRSLEYSISERPSQESLISGPTSTYFAVDQNHDGEIGALESYFAEFPLRLGSTMFDVVRIAPDGESITLRRSEAALVGSVLGELASEFDWTTTDGRELGRSSFEGKALVIDCWAPT